MTALVSWASLALAVLVLGRLLARGGVRNVLFSVAAFFVFFAYGPVLNLLQGKEVYSGILVSQVDVAVTGFALAMVGMAVGDRLAPQRMHFDASRVTSGSRLYQGLVIVLLVVSAYGLAFVVSHPLLVLADKLSAISAAGPRHYTYLGIQACAVATYFICRRSNLLRALWSINAVVYTAYCLMTSERDFLFVFFAILVHREMLENRSRAWRLGAVAAGAVAIGSVLFAYRADERFDMANTLNQGSILFVDTFIAGNVPSVYPYQRGGSYVDTLAHLAPSVITGPADSSLKAWLIALYAPGSRSGYGFSMTGEAYLNFGLAGIFVVFLLLTLGHRFVVNRADRNDWWAYFSVYSTATWLYALRGDSRELIKSLLYGGFFFLAVWLVSTVRQPHKRRQDGVQAVPATSGPEPDTSPLTTGGTHRISHPNLH
jgi:oligosaccharide repeat unit polymerase